MTDAGGKPDQEKRGVQRQESEWEDADARELQGQESPGNAEVRELQRQEREWEDADVRELQGRESVGRCGCAGAAGAGELGDMDAWERQRQHETGYGQRRRQIQERDGWKPD